MRLKAAGGIGEILEDIVCFWRVGRGGVGLTVAIEVTGRPPAIGIAWAAGGSEGPLVEVVDGKGKIGKAHRVSA